MRKIIFSIPITLDGYIEGPHRELDWVKADDELHDFYSDLLEQTDMILYGRRTYELMNSYWPNAPAEPAMTKSELRFANTVNPMKKIIYSTTLKKADWNAQVVNRFNLEEIKKMKEQPGKNIALGGGAELAQTFINNGLVDEYQLVVQPVVIGKGTSLFGGIQHIPKLEYAWMRSFQSGAVALCYRSNGSQ